MLRKKDESRAEGGKRRSPSRFMTESRERPAKWRSGCGGGRLEMSSFPVPQKFGCYMS